MEFQKNKLLQQYLITQKELGKRQREYKQLLNGQPRYFPEGRACRRKAGRRQTIRRANLQNNTELLKLEKDDLKAQIWTSMGALFEDSDRQNLAKVKCHIVCQEHLYDDIRQLKTDIINMQREISRITRDIYEINLKTIPEAMHHMHVAKTRKKIQILENQLEVGMRRECIFTAYNADLRKQLVDHIHFRRYFDDSYCRMVEQLNSDRKYMTELIEYVLNIYEDSIHICEKTMSHKSDEAKKDGQLSQIIYKIRHDELFLKNSNKFHSLKGKTRELADFQPKEYKRRNKFRTQHTDKIVRYRHVINMIIKYTNSNEGINGVIKKFQEQESLYYSYFNYANELSYHMTLLNNSVNSLFTNIQLHKINREETEQNKKNFIEQLEKTLKSRRESNAILNAQRRSLESKINSLFEGIGEIFKLTNADNSSLSTLLGDNRLVDLVNVRQYLKILEQRTFDITATVYCTERELSKTSLPIARTVQDLGHQCEEITQLDEIVLAQQCPECAESEAINDVDVGIAVIPDEKEFRKQLYEKIKQPEMQYRLHSISQCRLPRSRILAAKR